MYVFVCICVCVCVVWYMHACVCGCLVLCVCLHMEAKEDIKCLPTYIIPLGQGLSLNLELGWQPASPSNPFVTMPHRARVA